MFYNFLCITHILKGIVNVIPNTYTVQYIRQNIHSSTSQSKYVSKYGYVVRSTIVSIERQVAVSE